MDDISTSTLAGILIGLLIISAFFSSSETGMMTLNRYRLRHQAKNNNKGAQRASRLLERPDRLIGLILIGNNLVNILASSIATVIGIRLFHGYGVAVASIGLTIVVLIFAEVTPKTFAALNPERIAFPASVLLWPLMRLCYPLVVCVNFVSNALLRLVGVNPNNQTDKPLSSEELRSIVNDAGKMMPRRHQEMLLSILNLEQVTVEDVMVPRNEIAGIDVNADWKQIVKQLTNAHHTRMLLFRDNMDDIVGFVHARDALRMLTRDEFNKQTLLRTVRELYYIPEGTPLNVQLLKFQRAKEHIGLVVDEYGDIQGLVTLEDILEEIVGDFTTSVAPDTSDEVHPLPDGSYLVEGSANIRDLNKEMNWHFPTDGPKTLNGLILEVLEDIPEGNLSLRLAGYPVEVLAVKDTMITQVRIQPNLYQPPTEEER